MSEDLREIKERLLALEEKERIRQDRNRQERINSRLRVFVGRTAGNTTFRPAWDLHSMHEVEVKIKIKRRGWYQDYLALLEAIAMGKLDQEKPVDPVEYSYNLVSMPAADRADAAYTLICEKAKE